MSSWANKAAAKQGNNAAAAAANQAAAAPAAASSAAATAAAGPSAALKYYLTLLRGELVVASTIGGLSFEGLLHTLEWREAGSGDSCLVLRMAQQQVNGASNNVHPFVGVVKLPLAELVQVLASDISLAQWTQQYVDYVAKHGGGPSAAGPSRTAFATDSQISGASDKERELVRWSDELAAGADEDLMGLSGSSSSAAGFNQFETFERMTGKTTTFRFDDYSTPLDRNSAFYKSNEARAAAIANAIKASEAGSAHQRMEREEAADISVGDRDADEGDMFSDVRREGAATAAAAAGGQTKYKPGAFAKKKQLDAAPSPAKAVQTPPPAASASPKPLEISLAAQQKAAELAGSPKEPKDAAGSEAAAAAAAPAPVADASAAASASANTVAASSEGAPAAAAAAAAAPAAATPAPVKSKLNANAKAFKMSASAAPFVPGGMASAPASAAPVGGLPAGGLMAGGPVVPPNPLMFGQPMGLPLGMAMPYPAALNPAMQQQLLRMQQAAPQMQMGQPAGQFFMPPQQAAAQQQYLYQMAAAAAAAAGIQNPAFGMHGPNMAFQLPPQQQMRAGPPQNMQQQLFAQQQQQQQAAMQGFQQQPPPQAQQQQQPPPQQPQQPQQQFRPF